MEDEDGDKQMIKELIQATVDIVVALMVIMLFMLGGCILLAGIPSYHLLSKESKIEKK